MLLSSFQLRLYLSMRGQCQGSGVWLLLPDASISSLCCFRFLRIGVEEERLGWAEFASMSPVLLVIDILCDQGLCIYVVS